LAAWTCSPARRKSRWLVSCNAARTLLKQQRELSDTNPAIGELHRLEELQRREANHHSHWPTKQEWARAAGLSLQELQSRIDAGYVAWAEQAAIEAKELKLSLRNGRRAKDHMIQANLRLGRGCGQEIPTAGDGNP
jgi:RNA polymerase nonessential primary-like sigma factor